MLSGISEHPLMPVVAQWERKIKLGIDFKNERFGKDAAEGMKFYNGSYEFLFGPRRSRDDRHFVEAADDDNEIPPPRFQLTVNKTAELVQLFGPALYHKNPFRQVNPREFPLPNDDTAAAFFGNQSMILGLQQLYQQGLVAQAKDKVRAELLQFYLNYTPVALDLKTHSRRAIEEALIKGMSCLWVEKYTPPGGRNTLVGSFYDSVDNLVIDPDMPTLQSAKWIARRRCQPVWEVERKFGLPQGSLRGSCESLGQRAAVDADPDGIYHRARGETNDLLIYWEVYSKCGVGGRLYGIDPGVRNAVDVFGDYCYLAIAQGVPFPLNVPPSVWQMDAAQGQVEANRRLQWETPFWADAKWPFVPIYFHSVPGDPWPLSHLAPGMGELKFLNWLYSYIAGKIRITCRDFVAILEEAAPDIKEAIVRGTDFEIFKIKGSQGKSINEIVQFLQHPQWNNDIWKVAEAIGEQFDRRVGLTELMYGMTSKQIRSAQEAQLKQDQVSIRPDDMANMVEDSMTESARMEGLALRWHLNGKMVAPVMGPAGAALWDFFVTPADPNELLFNLEYRIEAGSIRKPNRDRDANNIQQFMQALGNFYQQLAAAGQVGPINTLIEQWGRVNDFKTDGLLVQPMAPPTPAPGQAPTTAATAA
jgi:hypothetical protein